MPSIKDSSARCHAVKLSLVDSKRDMPFTAKLTASRFQTPRASLRHTGEGHAVPLHGSHAVGPTRLQFVSIGSSGSSGKAVTPPLLAPVDSMQKGPFATGMPQPPSIMSIGCGTPLRGRSDAPPS